MRQHSRSGAWSGDVLLPGRLTPRRFGCYLGVAMANTTSLKLARRRDFLESGSEAAARFARTGVAFPHKEALRYVRARAAGKKARKPKPVRIPLSER
jgi:hypothetical protein